MASSIPVGVNPAGMLITKDGRYGYVANNNNYSLEGCDTVSVFDARTNLPITTLHHSSFNEPYTVTEWRGKILVTNSGGSTVTIIDMLSRKVESVIDGFDGPSGLVVPRSKSGREGRYAYVNEYGATPGVGSGNAKTVRVVDLKKREIVGSPIQVDLAPAAIASSECGRYVFTANYTTGNPNTGTISQISTKTREVVRTIGPFAESGLSGPFDILIRGRCAFVTNFGSNNFTPFGTTLSIVDLKRGEITQTFEVGIQPSGVALSLDGRYAYVSNYNTLYAYITPPPNVTYNNLTAGAGTVSVIDLKKQKTVKIIDVGQSPSYIAIHPNQQILYTSNYTSNTVSVAEL